MPTPANHFDADAYLEAMQRPSVTIDGRVFVGRLLSFDEWSAFAGRFTPAASGVRGNAIEQNQKFAALVRDVTTAILGTGRPWWAFWRPTIAQRIARLPAAAQIAFLNSFSRSQADAFEADAAALASLTGTTPSSKT